MSKTAKGLSAALIICVLAVVGGLFACKPLVEQAVRDALRNVNPDATICSIDTVDINPLSFTLKLGNIRISDQRTYDTVLKEATMTLSPRFVLACVPFLRDSILPAAGDAPLFSSATGRDLTEKSLIPGEPMTCTVEALTSGPVAMDAAVLKRLLNGQQVPEGEFMISIIAEKVTYGPVRISSTAPETPMQSSVAAVSIEGVDRRTWKRMTMDATEVIIRSEGAFKMGKLEIRDIFLPDADWFGRFLSLVRRADDLRFREPLYAHEARIVQNALHLLRSFQKARHGIRVAHLPRDDEAPAQDGRSTGLTHPLGRGLRNEQVARVPQVGPLVEMTLVGTREKAPLGALLRSRVSFFDKEVLFVDDGVIRQHLQGFEPCTVQRFVLLAREGEEFGQQDAVSRGDVGELGDDAVVLDAQQREFRFQGRGFQGSAHRITVLRFEGYECVAAAGWPDDG
mgnify:CR=1 FL=1